MPKGTKWKAKYKPTTCSTFGPLARYEHLMKQSVKKWKTTKEE